jgi:DNA-binding transcriptional ArsR family regulator
METIERLLFWLLEGTRGGPTRVQILSILQKKPMNLHQLSKAAGLDYKTVSHHMDLLERNSVVECSGNGYGQVYFVSEIVLAQKGLLGKLRGDAHGKKGKK